jgi:uracil-DNA glycosylase
MSVSPDALDDFIDQISVVKSPNDSVNFYAVDNCQSLGNANEIRRRNLRLFLNEMAQYKPELLLVGEAPGYRGCLLTGIPFTSEILLLEGVSSSQRKMGTPGKTRWKLFDRHQGYRTITSNEPPQKEATATMVWNFLRDLPVPPLVWNAYPFHPHRKDRINTNRPPTINELAIGNPFLAYLIKVFEINKVIAVGNKAHKALKMAGIVGKKVRHPSHGGKTEFEQELAILLDMPIF